MYVLRTMNSFRMSFWMVPLSFSGGDALLFGGDNVERHDRQHRAVHGHRHRHLLERNAVEENLHVENRIDGHAGLAHVARHALVVGVVAAVRRQIEGHGKPALARRQVAAVERVRLLGGGEARVLPDGPRPRGIHRRCTARADKAECPPHSSGVRAPPRSSRV